MLERQRLDDARFVGGEVVVGDRRSAGLQVGRDVARGRRSEIDFTNGLVAAKGAEVGVPAPTHAALTALIRRIDAGELKPDPQNIESLRC